MRLTGECVLEEHQITDISISFWCVKSLDILIYFQTGHGIYHHAFFPLGFVILFMPFPQRCSVCVYCEWMCVEEIEKLKDYEREKRNVKVLSRQFCESKIRCEVKRTLP